MKIHKNIRELRRALLSWYRRYSRDLPWRRTRDPYGVWLSEMMLQQTQVATVIPYYQRFLKAFPTVQSLAAAPLERVLELWAGLGYYARARHLHAAAREVVARHGGEFPATVDELMSLPGVGRYTAGAIASIAFEQKAAVVDGNVARVLARLFVMREPIKQPATQKRLWSLAESLLPMRKCGDFNQAMMELGATVCTPASPRCTQCPLRRMCGAYKANLVELLPRRQRKARPRVMEVAVVAFRSGDRCLFERRPEKGLWGGLWQLPSSECNNGRTGIESARSLAKLHGLKRAAIQLEPNAVVERLLSHRRVRFTIFHGTVPRGSTKYGTWLTLPESKGLAMSSAMRSILKVLSDKSRNTDVAV